MTGGVARGEGADAVFAQLRADIVEQRYSAGERLIEDRIAGRLGVSRTPVRDALRRLTAEGLVTIEPNRGASVRSLSEQDVIDLYGLRARLEAYAAELAASRITESELAALASAADEFSALCNAIGDSPPGDIETARQLSASNAAVHDGVLTGAHHERLRVVLQRTVDGPLVFGAFRVFGPEERHRSDLFHRLVVDAIRRRDGVRAAELMSEHVAQGCDAVARELRAKALP